MFLSGQRPRNARSSSILAHHLHLTRPRSTSRFHRSPPTTCPRQRNGKRTFYAGLQRACPTAVALSLHAKHSYSFVPKCVSGTAPRPAVRLQCSLRHLQRRAAALCDYQHQCHREPGAVRRAAEQEQAVVLDASRPSDCIDLLRRLSHAHRETCHVRASFDLHAKRPQVLVCSHRVGKHARVGRSRPVRGPSHCPTHRRCVSLSGVRAVPQHCVPDVRRQPGWASPVHMLWEGLVEIKCPYTLRESGDFGQLAWMCLVDDKYCLSRNHRHFFQVQMQLFVANKSSLCGRRKACSLRGFTLIGNGG